MTQVIFNLCTGVGEASTKCRTILLLINNICLCFSHTKTMLVLISVIDVI